MHLLKCSELLVVCCYAVASVYQVVFSMLLSGYFVAQVLKPVHNKNDNFNLNHNA